MPLSAISLKVSWESNLFSKTTGCIASIIVSIGQPTFSSAKIISLPNNAFRFLQRPSGRQNSQKILLVLFVSISKLTSLEATGRIFSVKVSVNFVFVQVHSILLSSSSFIKNLVCFSCQLLCVCMMLLFLDLVFSCASHCISSSIR